MLNLQEAYLSIYSEEDENERRRSALAKADRNYRYQRGNQVRDKVSKLINSENPEEVKRGWKIHAANAKGAKSSIAKSARNIQRGPGPRMAKADAERDMRASGFKEEVDVYDLVLDYLLDEGFVETEEAAVNIMSVMSEEWIESILQEFEFKNTPPETMARLRKALSNLAKKQEEIRKKNPTAPEEKKKPRRTDLSKVAIR